MLFFFNDTATTEIYTLSLHDALPIYLVVIQPAREHPVDRREDVHLGRGVGVLPLHLHSGARRRAAGEDVGHRSEEHTSELQSRQYLVCRLLLEKKKKNKIH